MNKIPLIILTQLVLISSLCAQELYFIQYVNSSKEYVTVKYLNGKIESVNEMAGFNFHVLSNSTIYHSNIYEIFTFSFSNPTSKTLLKPKIDNTNNTPDAEEYILSFDVSPNGNIYYEIGAETYRLNTGACKLYKWSNGIESRLFIPYDMNFINFDISPNEEQIAFQHTISTDERNIDYLILFDFITSQIDTIASGISTPVNMDQLFTEWDGRNVLFLNEGKIFKYDTKSKKTTIVNIPFNGEIDDFEKVGTDFYFTDGYSLYQWNGNEIKELYQSDRFDYITCLRKKNGL